MWGSRLLACAQIASWVAAGCVLTACGDNHIRLYGPDGAPVAREPAGTGAAEATGATDMLEPRGADQAAPDAADVGLGDAVAMDPAPTVATTRTGTSGEAVVDGAAGADGAATLADPEQPEPAPSAGLQNALLLRYDFEGEGDKVIDRVGSADAKVLGGAMLDGAGGLSLDGVDDYVDMPNGVLSGLESLTISAWVTWHGGVCWQRIFDFGSTDMGEDQVGNATTSLFLTPASCPAGVLTVMSERTADKQSLLAAAPLPEARLTHVTLSLDAGRSEATLYVDGVLEAQAPTSHAMQDLQDVNNWLGRSQWIQDHYLEARFEELRIYGRALEPSDVAALHELGPDAL